MTEEQIVTEKQPTGIADVEAEHAMQYSLLAEAERLLGEHNIEQAKVVLRQLYDYSEAHFGSEQVLMRLYSYAGYQSHEREHGELLTALDALLKDVASETAAASATAIRRWLNSHIHHSDHAFMQTMKKA